MDKSIDLGKLQDAVRFQQSVVKKSETLLKTAQNNFDKARTIRDNCIHNLSSAKEALDTTKAAMLEAARTVAAS